MKKILTAQEPHIGQERDRESAAYYQAGQAVMLYLFGHKIMGIRLRRFADGGGLIKYRLHEPTSYIISSPSETEKRSLEVKKIYDRRMQQFALIYYAGHCAKFKFRQKTIPDKFVLSEIFETDICKITQAIFRLNEILGEVRYGKSDMFRWMNECDKIVRTTRVWGVIKKLAAAISSSGREGLSSSEITNILKKGLTPFMAKTMWKQNFDILEIHMPTGDLS